MHHFGTRYQCIYIRVQSYKKVKKNAISPADISARVDENCQCSQVTGIACDCTPFFQFNENLNTCIPSSDSQKCINFKYLHGRTFLQGCIFLQKCIVESNQERYFKMFVRWWVQRKCLLCKKWLYSGWFSNWLAKFHVTSTWTGPGGLSVIGKQLKTIKR